MAKNHYEIPSWAGKPPIGLHLDVMKEGRFHQKLMLDQKKCYLFGRNPDMNDFVIDHQSCSRVHAALVYHKHLNRAFLVDLGSTHGTHIGNIRLESRKPTQLPVDSEFHFGASTRTYVIRERPQKIGAQGKGDDGKKEELDGSLLGLPETELEVDNLTEYNTAHNRRVTTLGIPDEEIKAPNRVKKRKHVGFMEEDEVINPEDIDPNVGRFRNLAQTVVIPRKKARSDDSESRSSMDSSKTFHPSKNPYGHERTDNETSAARMNSTFFSPLLSAKLGLHLPNPAPEPDMDLFSSLPAPSSGAVPVSSSGPPTAGLDSEPKKKKYAKEAWPGKKNTAAPSLF